MVNNTIIYIHVRYKLWDGFGSNLIRKMLFCFFWWIYYSYYAGNPVSRVDPNGRDFWDVLKGIGVSISDNATLGGVNRRGTIAYKDASDYNLGQDIGDALRVIIGGGEAFTGMGGTIFGTGISATGVGAVVGAPVMAEGALMTAHGTLMMFSAGKNLNSQKGRVDEGSGKDKRNVSSGNKNSPHANQKAKISAGQKYERAKERFNQLKNMPNKTPEQKKERDAAKREMDHWKKSRISPVRITVETQKGIKYGKIYVYSGI